MQFPLFEAQIAITFGVSALSSESMQALRDANEQLIKLSSYIPDTDLPTIKNTLITDIKNLDVHNFHQMSVAYRQDCQQQRLHTWYEKQLEELRKTETWDAFNSASIPHNTLKQLQSEFGPQLPLANWQSKNIIELITSVMPVFENYVQYARTEIKAKRHSLQTKLTMEFNNYLDKLQNHLITTKHMIMDAILMRLTIASDKKNLHDDDVVLNMLEKLQNMNLFKQQSFSLYRRGLTPDIFEFFHHYVLHNGNKQQINQLKNLIWFQSDSMFGVCARKDAIFIAPLNMMRAGLIPEKARFPKFLFKGHNFRHHFFVRHFYFMIQLKMLTHSKVKNFQLTHLLENDTWKMLTNTAEHIKAQLALYPSKPKTWWETLFRKTTTLFLNNWLGFLQTKAREVLQLKINYASYVLQQLETRLQFDIDSHVLSSQNFHQALAVLVNDIEHSLVANVDAKLQKQWRTIKPHFDRILHKKIDTANKKRDDVSELQKQSQAILKNLIKHNHFMFDGKDVNQQINSMLIIFSKLQNCPNLTKYTEDLIHTIFVSYLNTCMIAYEQQFIPKSLPSIENILLRYAPSHLKNQCLELSKIKFKNDYAFYTKCKALLYGLNNQQETKPLADAKRSSYEYC